MRAQRIGMIVLLINLIVSLAVVPGRIESRTRDDTHMSGNVFGGGIHNDHGTLQLINTSVSTVVGSNSVLAGSFAHVQVPCPADTVAVGGGIDLENVLTMVVTSSGP